MKKIVEVTEAQSEGLKALLGQNVLIFCLNYIYTGKLSRVGKSCILLEDPAIVYETGPFTEKGYSDAQELHVNLWYVNQSAIESFGPGK